MRRTKRPPGFARGRPLTPPSAVLPYGAPAVVPAALAAGPEPEAGGGGARQEARRTDFVVLAADTVRAGTSPRRTGLSGDQALGRLPDFRTLGADCRGNLQNRPDVCEFDVTEADTRRQATGHGHVILTDLPTGGSSPDRTTGRTTPTNTAEPGASLLVDHVFVETTTGGSAK